MAVDMNCSRLTSLVNRSCRSTNRKQAGYPCCYRHRRYQSDAADQRAQYLLRNNLLVDNAIPRLTRCYEEDQEGQRCSRVSKRERVYRCCYVIPPYVRYAPEQFVRSQGRVVVSKFEHSRCLTYGDVVQYAQSTDYYAAEEQARRFTCPPCATCK